MLEKPCETKQEIDDIGHVAASVAMVEEPPSVINGVARKRYSAGRPGGVAKKRYSACHRSIS